MLRKVAGALVLAIAAIWLWNASFLSTPSADTAPKLIAHRGVAQAYHREGLTNETCTAERILPPTHGYLENTTESIHAAFAYGADVVELDVHQTTDGAFAIFHDWTLDCRTDGTGVTREAAMSNLKMLDIGHGYTADDGETFPFRGQFVGAMPSLSEVMDSAPPGRLLINFKSGWAEEGQALADAVKANPGWQPQIWGYYGGHEPSIAAARATGLPASTRPVLKKCALRYLTIGWTGHVPEACHDTMLFVPQNYTWAIWGWPHKFTARMEKAGTAVVLIGPHEKGGIGTTGIDTAEMLDRVPERYAGYIWTDRIEVIGPLVTARTDAAGSTGP